MERVGETCRLFSVIGTFRRWAKQGILILQVVNKNSQAIGVSRGGKTTKIHAIVNENFQLLNVMLTAGNVNDAECAVALLKPMQIEDKKVLADRAHSSYYIRTFIERNSLHS